jgi:hypothetical protein
MGASALPPRRFAAIRPPRSGGERDSQSPDFQLGTMLSSVDGSAAAPFVVSSLNKNPATVRVLLSAWGRTAYRLTGSLDALISADSAREPPDERTEHQPDLGGERNVGGHAHKDAEC